jgi:hypothetical protein
MRRVKIVFLGFGRMGQAAFASLKEIQKGLLEQSIEPCLLAIFEADEKLIPAIEPITGAKPVFVDKNPGSPGQLSRLFRRDVAIDGQDEFLVYDATPSNCHLANLVAVCSGFPRAIYLGEKPILTSREGLAVLGRYQDRVLCDFVDTQNDAILKLLELQRNGLVIRKMRFWRLNSSGLQKLAMPHCRRGVEGGALLDKGIHDIALSTVLLRNQKQFPARWMVDDASIFAWMPNCSPALTGHPEMADAAGYANIHSGSGSTSVEFHFSWIGVRRFCTLTRELGKAPLPALMGRLGLKEASWLWHPYDPWKCLYEEEARIAIIEGRHQGRDRQLVINLLTRPGIRPFIFDATDSAFLPLSMHSVSKTPLARVLESAIQSVGSSKTLAFDILGASTIRQAHQTCFDIQDRANSVATSWLPIHADSDPSHPQPASVSILRQGKLVLDLS